MTMRNSRACNGRYKGKQIREHVHMDILETLFPSLHANKEVEENEQEDANEEEYESGSDEEEPPSKLLKVEKQPKHISRRSRPERGKFTILNDGAEVAEPDRILDIDFTVELLQKIFKDSRLGIQFLARYGIIPNMRECKIDSCPKEQMMSLIKHANSYVWRCRSCRKRRERRVITKISVYEGTFLFYSRMPLNKFFIFMLIWCDNPGYTAAEYNRLLGEYRLVEETIHNTIGFIRDHIQNWCHLQVSREKIGGDGQIIELIDTFHTEDVSAKHRNRRERHFSMRLLLICWKMEKLAIVDFAERQYTKQTLLEAVKNHVAEGSIVVMKDLLMDKFGEQDSLNIIFAGKYSIRTIADVWLKIDEEEKDKQFVKTLMESCISASSSSEPFGYEYYFRRRFLTKPFNNFLKAIRELYSNVVTPGYGYRSDSYPYP